jgi:hypothetical protein
MSKKYVVFNEIESEAPLGEYELPLLQFAVLGDFGFIETAMRSRATEFATARAAYAHAGRFRELGDWRVGVR